MFTVLGKRKRRQDRSDDIATAISPDAQALYQDAIRKHFEANFESIGSLASGSSTLPFSEHSDSESQTPNADVESEWGGLSDTEDVEVISHIATTIVYEDGETSRSLRKKFMSSRPPQDDTNLPAIANNTRSKEETSPKNISDLTAEDIALQRLLSESHLLQGSNESMLSPILKSRQAAQDLRLRALGAKQSVKEIGAGNTPMSVRKGIESKKRVQEQGRRKEAKESGIILEHVGKSSSKDRRQKKSRDVGAPAVGKWRGGTLILGKRDVAEIEGQRLSSSFGKKRKGSSKGRKR